MSISVDWVSFALGFGSFPALALLMLAIVAFAGRWLAGIAMALKVMWKAQIRVFVKCEVCAGLSFVWRIRALSNRWAKNMPPYHPVWIQSMVLVCRACLPSVDDDFHKSISP